MTIKKIESSIKLDTENNHISVDEIIEFDDEISRFETSIYKNIKDVEISINNKKIKPIILHKEETTIVKIDGQEKFDKIQANYTYEFNKLPIIISKDSYKIPLFIDENTSKNIELKIISPKNISVILKGTKIDEFKDDEQSITMWNANTKDFTIILGKYTRLSEMKEGIIIAVMYRDVSAENKDNARKIKELVYNIKKTIQENFGEIDIKDITIVQVPDDAPTVDTGYIITIPDNLFSRPESDETLLYLLRKIVTPHMIPALDTKADGFGFLKYSLPEYAIIPILDEMGRSDLSEKILSNTYKELIELRKKLEDEHPLIEINPNNTELWQRQDMQKLLKLKGMIVLHMMRILAKDKGFFATIRAYNKRHKDTPATIEDFQYIAEANSHLQFGWFVQQWIYDISMIKPNIESIEIKEENGKYNVSIEVSNTGLAQMPIEVEIQTENPKDNVTRTIWMTPDSNRELKVTVKSRPVKIKLDPRHWVYKDTEDTIQEKTL